MSLWNYRCQSVWCQNYDK